MSPNLPEGYIPLGAVFALRWQLNPTQVKCTCNANDSTYIPNRLLIKMKNIQGSIMNVQILLKKRLVSLLLKKIFEVYSTQNILFYLPKGDPKTTWWNIGLRVSSRDKILQSDWSLLSDLFKSNKSAVPQAEMT